jgi:protein-S-isoprenylcysteine O-methyltransferase Ste14
MSQPSERAAGGWRAVVFKNRGLLLLPVVLILVIFGKPTVASALVGVGIALLGEAIRVWAVGYSGTTTRANVVTAPQLITAGPYSYIRNPLYVGNALTALGFWVAFSGALSATSALTMLAVIALLVLTVYGTIIPLEEAYLLRTFGPQYQQYVERVPRVIPSRRPVPDDLQYGAWRPEVIARAEVITIAFFTLMVAAVWLKLTLAR